MMSFRLFFISGTEISFACQLHLDVKNMSDLTEILIDTYLIY